MKNRSKKEQIMRYIDERTVELINEDRLDGNGVEASDIAIDLKLDRANVSRDLNSLWKSGALIKIAGRPVFYLSAEKLNEKYRNIHIPSYIAIDEKISVYLNNEPAESAFPGGEDHDFASIIGNSGSLSSELEKAKAAVSYPPYGLHTIINGNSGTEKSYIANAMVSYAINNKLRNGRCPYYEIDCRGYSGNLIEELCGVYDKDGPAAGLFQKSSNGFLILEHIEYLSSANIDLIAAIISKNYYSRINANEQIELKCMLILTTNLSFEDPLIKDLAGYIPIKIHLTDIDSRGIYEKYELIMDLFSREARRLGTAIKVSKDVLSYLAGIRFDNNISELENLIKSICSRVYVNKPSTKMIDVSFYSLPQELLELTQNRLSSVSKASATSLLKIIESDYLYFNENGYSKDFNDFKEFPLQSRSHLLSQFVDEFDVDVSSLSSLEDYVNENIDCLKNCSDTYLKALRNNIDPYIMSITTSILFSDPRYQVLSNHQELLYGILLHISNSIRRIISKNYRSSNMPLLSEKMYSEECQLAKKIYSYFEKKYNFIVDNREIDYLASYLAITSKYVNRTNVAILVIAHGQSIASQLVRYVKENVEGDYYIDAIDFNEDMQLNDLLELSCIKASELNQGSGVLIVTDKEPLTTISEYIIRTTGISAKTIYPLTLSGLLEIVSRSSSTINDLESLVLANPIQQNYRFRNDDRDEFIKAISDKIIAKSVTFIDTAKIVDILKVCLNDTLRELKIAYSNDIAAKYLCHCSIMIERVIRKEPWESGRLKKYIANNYKLFNTIEHCFEYANNSLGIKIPQSELLYVSEMFEPYV